MRAMFCLVIMSAIGAPQAMAQPAHGRTDRWRTTTELPPASAASRPAKSCAEYGPDFVRVAGSGSCVRIGGSTSIGASGSGRGGGR